jgi:hypothetical protein
MGFWKAFDDAIAASPVGWFFRLEGSGHVSIFCSITIQIPFLFNNYCQWGDANISTTVESMAGY